MSKYIGPKELNRQRNQFSRNERDRLLNIMKEFGQRLDDKNLSILARKEIWMTIDKKFHEGGFSDRTIAQLKKYWQNYKYHNTRNKWRKLQEDTFFIPPSAVQNTLYLNCQHPNYADQPYFMPDEPDLSPDSVKQSDIVISNTDTSGSSVTVSVINPEINNDKTFSNKRDGLMSLTNETKNMQFEVNESKKVNGKFCLFEPRKLHNSETSSRFIESKNDFSVEKTSSNSSSDSLQPSRKNYDDITIDQMTELNYSRNSRNSKNQIGEYNMQIDYANRQQNFRDISQYANIHVIRQLQLLRQLEAEEHWLKTKLAEMTLKELHLRILQKREYVHVRNGKGKIISNGT